MEIKGKVIKVLPLQTGEGRNGPWKKQEFILELPGQYQKKVCFSLWGDNVQQYPVNEGEEVTVLFDLESREYNNRWYTEAKAWKIVKADAAPADSGLKSDDFPFEVKEEDWQNKNAPQNTFDDLPF